MAKKPTLRWDLNSGEAGVHFSSEWKEMGSLLRADILGDWIHDLTQEYNRSVAEMLNEWEKNRQKRKT